jgi:hypothetical protein
MKYHRKGTCSAVAIVAVLLSLVTAGADAARRAWTGTNSGVWPAAGS